jgi:ubiquinone/menaquinone biosynthesis C-methylase UbiE
MAHDWREAGNAWGHAANDWACFWEHYSTPTVTAIFDRLGVGPGVRLLDVACGSGGVARLARSMGAEVVGIDAAEELVDIAQLRNPDADIRVGSMFELPWEDESFDAVVSINGIWGGNDDALSEAHRVLRPGGGIGISFWGPGPPLDLRLAFKVVALHSPDPHVGGMRELNNISFDGVAEKMLRAAGFVELERGKRIAVVEWPDADITWRAISSGGPVVPALAHTDPKVLEREVLEAIDHCRDRRGVYRFENDHQFVTGRKP